MLPLASPPGCTATPGGFHTMPWSLKRSAMLFASFEVMLISMPSYSLVEYQGIREMISSYFLPVLQRRWQHNHNNDRSYLASSFGRLCGLSTSWLVINLSWGLQSTPPSAHYGESFCRPSQWWSRCQTCVGCANSTVQHWWGLPIIHWKPSLM